MSNWKMEGERTLIVTAILPGHPPSVNGAYATHNGHRITTRAAKEWKSMAQAELFLQQMRRVDNRAADVIRPAHGQLMELEIDFLGMPFTRDIDGGVKLLQDVLIETCSPGNDDRYIVKLVVRKLDAEERETEVRLYMYNCYAPRTEKKRASGTLSSGQGV